MTQSKITAASTDHSVFLRIASSLDFCYVRRRVDQDLPPSPSPYSAAGSTIFLTWRLRGSLPPGFVFDIPDQRELSDGVSFGKMDKLLDTATQGPRWLADSAIAEEVCRTIERGAEAPLFQYVLHEYVVMPNHVHLLISPRTDVSRIMQGIKGTTARFANLQLGRTGESFWQDEVFDRFCRSAEEFQRIRGYIARNPVRAGLAKAMDEWPWSSAHRRGTHL